MMWRHVYREEVPLWQLAAAGIAGGAAGLLALWLMPGLGAGAIPIPACGVPLALRCAGSRLAVTCDPQGFTVVNRRWCRTRPPARYAWHEVTSIEHSQAAGAAGDPGGKFRVGTTAGLAFHVRASSNQSRDLLALFRSMTEHQDARD